MSEYLWNGSIAGKRRKDVAGARAELKSPRPHLDERSKFLLQLELGLSKLFQSQEVEFLCVGLGYLPTSLQFCHVHKIMPHSVVLLSFSGGTMDLESIWKMLKVHFV